MDVRERAANWNKVFERLGLTVRILPASVCGLPAYWGDVVVLEGFGAPNGMILLPDTAGVLLHSDTIAAQGFAFSVVEPNEDPSDPEAHESTIEMLRDWGWCGSADARPAWY